MESCINLQERFGQRYRIGWEADGTTRGQWPEADRPWLREIRCKRRGVIYPQGGEILAAMTPRTRVAARLRALPCILSVRGALETIVTFHVDHADAVFEIMQPYKRRKVSASTFANLAKAQEAQKARTRDAITEPESTNATQDKGRAE